jgi:hypothetical protein
MVLVVFYDRPVLVMGVIVVVNMLVMGINLRRVMTDGIENVRNLVNEVFVAVFSVGFIVVTKVTEN